MPADPFDGLNPVRPRLMATHAAVAIMCRVLEKDPTAREWSAIVEEQAEHILTLPPLTPCWQHDPVESANAPAPLPSYKDDPDAPASWLDIARLFLLRIQTLGIMWFAKGDTRFRDRARVELLAVCAFPNWTGDEFLVTSEMMCGAALGYDWLFEHLSEPERAAVVEAISTKGIIPGLNEFEAKKTWTNSKTNWNLVCNGSLMIAALAIVEDNRPLATRIFDLCLQSVPIGFSMYRPDGGWVEGPGYWHYATQYAVYLIDSLDTALHHDFELGRTQGFGNTGLYRLHVGGATGKLFNYADSEDHHSGGYWLFWLARRYKHPVDAWVEETRSKVHPMDLLWFDPYAKRPKVGAPPTRKTFKGAQVTMLRRNWIDPQEVYVGIKAGENDSCTHSHYDLGSFVFESGGIRWAIDLGPDNYQLPDYFKPSARLLYYRTNTLGHNTLVMNGASQPPNARAQIIGQQFGPKLSTLVLDLSNAYSCTKTCFRGFVLVDNKELFIIDEIEPGADCETIAWQMHTKGIPEAAGNQAHIQGVDPNGIAQHLYLRIVEPAGAEFTIAPATPTGPAGQNPNTGITKLVIGFKQPLEPVRLVVALTPEDTQDRPSLPSEVQAPLATLNLTD